RSKREESASQFYAQPDIRYLGIAGFELRMADRARFLAKYPSLLHGVQFTSSDRLLQRNQDRVDSYWIWYAAVLAVVQRFQFAVDTNFWCPSQKFRRFVQPQQRLGVHL